MPQGYGGPRATARHAPGEPVPAPCPCLHGPAAGARGRAAPILAGMATTGGRIGDGCARSVPLVGAGRQRRRAGSGERGR